jgi:hypothetical protein
MEDGKLSCSLLQTNVKYHSSGEKRDRASLETMEIFLQNLPLKAHIT